MGGSDFFVPEGGGVNEINRINELNVFVGGEDGSDNAI